MKKGSDSNKVNPPLFLNYTLIGIVSPIDCFTPLSPKTQFLINGNFLHLEKFK